MFVMPDDLDFIYTIDSLDNPEKIGNYMINNFIYDLNYRNRILSPYSLWKIKKGVCGDFATFSHFVANYHSIKSYFVLVFFYEIIDGHAITIFKENSLYSYSSNLEYFNIKVSSIEEVISHLDNCTPYKIKGYKIINEP
jgi:hypothetical protein